MTPRRKRIILISIIVVLLVAPMLVRAMMYTVDERELAVILQFGDPVESRSEPGLYFNMPFVQEVRRLPKTYQFWSGATEVLVDLPTADDMKVEVTPWAVWRITDPKKFVQVLRTVEKGEMRIKQIVRNTVRDVITSHDLVEAVRDSSHLTEIYQEEEPKTSPPVGQAEIPSSVISPDLAAAAEQGSERPVPILLGRTKIVEEIKALVQEKLEKLVQEKLAEGAPDGEAEPEGGVIELVDLGIARIDFVPTVREAAFNRQIASMQKIAAGNVAQGEKRRDEMIFQAEAQAEEIRGQGEKDALKTRGDVDAEITRKFALAIREAGEFYRFTRALEAYKKATASRTHLILTTDSEFFRFLQSSGTGETVPVRPVRPGTGLGTP
ncbi:MAG: protease modulator HflC [Planctomycetes bacterium]|nr:protease modulator HflC [Planctomycetota bacterium]